MSWHVRLVMSKQADYGRLSTATAKGATSVVGARSGVVPERCRLGND